MTKRPYDYGTHECLDRTYLVMELFSYVSEHPQVVDNPEWKAMADRVHDEMWKLYQAIGNSDMEDFIDDVMKADSAIMKHLKAAEDREDDARRALIQQVQTILSKFK